MKAAIDENRDIRQFICEFEKDLKGGGMSLRFDSKLLTAAAAACSLFLIPAHAMPQQGGDAAAKPTPHLANGHPDLNGVWDPWSGHVIRSDEDSRNGLGEVQKNGSVIVLYDQNRALAERAKGTAEPEAPAQQRPRMMPPYKPELVARVNDLFARQNRVDPIYECKAPGVPRIGPPQEIIQGANRLVFIYSDLAGNFWRIIPTDGTPHNADADPSYLGDSIGHWEGDTLVVDDVNFTDDTWLAGGGTFHSQALHVTERLTRHGDSLAYEVTVEDPMVLTGPWKMPARTLKVSETPLEEAPPCKDMDQQHFVTFDHH
jgi:hypothetical protein